ncbi:MAG: hypothetical protein F4057_06335 [Acidobacteria bacterium]|nr:hypothetical protein [Acidobacteriota bacterium]
MDIRAIAAFVLVGLASPVLAYAARALIDRHRTRAAQKVLDAAPLVFEGSRFRKLLAAGGAQLMGAGRIVEMERGRLLAAGDDGALVPFDALEFKSMWPHWLPGEARGSGAPGALPAPAASQGPGPGPGSAREEAYS